MLVTLLLYQPVIYYYHFIAVPTSWDLPEIILFHATLKLPHMFFPYTLLDDRRTTTALTDIERGSDTDVVGQRWE
ncbi:hypothetical protein PM082_011909 [Marasmius tenuissimus]|nr:hypothetical protein PM082_011909 [Marasmius tenuissimus]